MLILATTGGSSPPDGSEQRRLQMKRIVKFKLVINALAEVKYSLMALRWVWFDNKCTLEVLDWMYWGGFIGSCEKGLEWARDMGKRYSQKYKVPYSEEVISFPIAKG